MRCRGCPSTQGASASASFASAPRLDRHRTKLDAAELEVFEGRYLALRGSIPAEGPRAAYVDLAEKIAALEHDVRGRTR